VKFCTNQRVRVSDKEKLLLLRTELGTNLEPQFGLAAQTRSSEKLLLDFGFLRVSLDQRQSRSPEPTTPFVYLKWCKTIIIDQMIPVSCLLEIISL
jgi:hypothetical protein